MIHQHNNNMYIHLCKYLIVDQGSLDNMAIKLAKEYHRTFDCTLRK